MILSTGGNAWLGGVMRGWGGMHGRGACMAGGHAWPGGEGWIACMAGDMHGGGACMVVGACMTQMPPSPGADTTATDYDQ